ncbi:MAG: molecular chaperone DnaJ [Deltaproteobacteria bacterium]|nr:molecular chaperone DnaJ [Deltaproteobacteria bacterium]
MSTEQRLVPVAGERPAPSAEAARLRVRALLDEVSRLDAGIEELSRGLDDFARRWESEVGPALAELSEAEGLVRRLQRIEDEIGRLGALLREAGEEARPSRPARRRGRGGRPSGARGDAGGAREETEEGQDDAQGPAAGEPAPEIAAAEVLLKRLWRRLARVLHPDLAGSEADRGRLTGLMARANAAYEAGDLAALELLAERIGAGEDPEVPDEAARLAHLARREAALAEVRRSLRAEEARLRQSATARLRGEAEARAGAGGDLRAETRAAAVADAAAARQDALARLARIYQAAGALARQRRKAMDRIRRRGPTGALRPFDPVAESPLVRQGLRLVEARRAGPAARELARWLEEKAHAEVPWEAALTLLAFVGEAAGTPPDAMASAGALAATWAAVVEGWDAPDLPRALARLPRHLALGMRARGKELDFGAQLASPELGPGVRLALGRERVTALLSRVLAALGPVLPCRGCGEEERRALHLLRLRGLDEVHGLVCPGCGSVLRSYWQYGEPGGLEALAPLALEAGLVAEVSLRFAGAPLALQLLPAERQALTGTALRERLAAVLFAPYRIEVEARHLRLRSKAGEVGPRQRVPAGRLVLGLHAAGLGEAEALELLRSRIERRFRE